MHHGDLAGRAAEIDAADLEPEPEELGEHGRTAPAARSSWSRGFGLGQLWRLRGKAQVGEQLNRRPVKPCCKHPSS